MTYPDDGSPGKTRGAISAPEAAGRSAVQTSSVEAVRLPERPCAARIAITALDIPEAPDDLRLRVRRPVRAGSGHLGSRQCLRDSERAAGILGLVVPAALPAPDVVQAAEVRLRIPAIRRQQAVRDRLRGAGIWRWR